MRAPRLSDILGIDMNREEVPIENKVSDQAELGPKEVYFEWEVEGRPYKKSLNIRATRTLLIIAIVVGLLLAVMQEFAIILLIASIIFINHQD